MNFSNFYFIFFSRIDNLFWIVHAKMPTYIKLESRVPPPSINDARSLSRDRTFRARLIYICIVIKFVMIFIHVCVIVLFISDSILKGPKEGKMVTSLFRNPRMRKRIWYGRDSNRETWAGPNSLLYHDTLCMTCIVNFVLCFLSWWINA